MKKLLQISLDTLLISILPIAMWIILGTILTKDISNVFSLTYPLQFFYAFFESIFSKGANIAAKKKDDKSIVDTNILVGMLFVGLLISILILNIDTYIRFMNMDPTIYHNFCIYSVLWMYISFVIYMILQKLYFENQNDKANRMCFIVNIINFSLIIILSFFLKSIFAIGITLAIDFSILVYIIYKNIDITKFKLNLKDSISYSSFSIIRNICMFLTYGIGMSRSFSYGEEFVVAMTFEGLITDTQWDVLDSVDTLSKVDLSTNDFDYRKSLKNAYKLLSILIASIILFAMILYSFYRPNLKILSIILSVQIVDMLTNPLTILRMSYLQINDNKSKHNIYIVFTRIIRVLCSFIPSAFCTYISQTVSMLLLLIYSYVQCREVPSFKLKK